MHAGDILQIAIDRSDRPAKAFARDVGYSEVSIYSAINGTRPIWAMARRKIARINVFGFMAVALEATGLAKIFGLDIY